MELSNLGLKKAPSPLPWRLELSEKKHHDRPHVSHPRCSTHFLPRNHSEIFEKAKWKSSRWRIYNLNLPKSSFCFFLGSFGENFQLVVFFFCFFQKKKHPPWHWKIQLLVVAHLPGPKPNEIPCSTCCSPRLDTAYRWICGALDVWLQRPTDPEKT